jgi:putative transposase
MKKSRFSDQQIAFALQQAETGTSVADVCRKLGISEATFYRWKERCGALMPSEVRKLKHLEEENARLRKLVSDLSLDKEMLQEVLRKKSLRPAQGRELVDHVRTCFRIGTRRACRVLVLHRSMYLYRSRRPEQAVLRKRIREIAQTRVRCGYRRIHILLRREGWPVGRECTGSIDSKGCKCVTNRPSVGSWPSFETIVRRLLHPMTVGPWIGCTISSSTEGGFGS